MLKTMLTLWRVEGSHVSRPAPHYAEALPALHASRTQHVEIPAGALAGAQGASQSPEAQRFQTGCVPANAKHVFRSSRERDQTRHVKP